MVDTLVIHRAMTCTFLFYFFFIYKHKVQFETYLYDRYGSLPTRGHLTPCGGWLPLCGFVWHTLVHISPYFVHILVFTGVIHLRSLLWRWVIWAVFSFCKNCGLNRTLLYYIFSCYFYFIFGVSCTNSRVLLLLRLLWVLGKFYVFFFFPSIFLYCGNLCDYILVVTAD